MQTSARSIPTRVVPGASALHRVAPQAPIAGQAATRCRRVSSGFPARSVRPSVVAPLLKRSCAVPRAPGRVTSLHATEEEAAALVGEDSADFKLEEQTVKAWATFFFLLTSVLGGLYLVRIPQRNPCLPGGLCRSSCLAQDDVALAHRFGSSRAQDLPATTWSSSRASQMATQRHGYRPALLQPGDVSPSRSSLISSFPAIPLQRDRTEGSVAAAAGNHDCHPRDLCCCPQWPGRTALQGGGCGRRAGLPRDLCAGEPIPGDRGPGVLHQPPLLRHPALERPRHALPP